MGALMDREAFLAEIEAVCRKRGISISHEDHHGAFNLEPFSEDRLEWLKAAEFVQPQVRDTTLDAAAASIGDLIG
jgi:hypothetical protein